MPLLGESNLRQGFSNVAAGWHSQFSGNIPNSCSFDNDDSQYLERTTSSHSSNEVTLACWFQHIDEADGRMRGGNIGIISIGDGSSSGSPNNGIFISSGVIYLYANGQGATTNALFGDQGWYHLIASYKLDESTGPGKGRLFVNGVEITDWNADPRVSGWGTSFNNVSKQFVGLLANATSPDGYIAQPVFLDGQSIQGGDWTVDSFLDTYAVTPNRSVRTPKSNDDIKTLVDAAPSNNSAFLPFTNASAMGNDGSTHGNNFSLNNISSADQSSHTPSQVYVHWNGRANTFTGDNGLGNPAQGRIDDHGTTLNADTQSVSGDVTGVGDLFIDTTANSGKYYLEYQFGGGSFAGSYYVGFIGDRNADHLGDGGQQVGYQGPEATDKIIFYASNGTTAGQMQYFIDADSAVNLTLASGGSFPRIVSASDRLGILYDFDNNQVVMYDKDGNASTPVSWTPDSPSISIHARGNGINGTIFTDSADWTHSVANVKEWKSENISAPTYNGVDYFDATSYEGNGGVQRVGDFVPFTDAYTVTNSAMFDYDDKRYLSFTPDSGGNQKTFTFSFWFKLTGLSDPSSVNAVLTTKTTKQSEISFRSSGGIKPNDQTLRVALYNGSSFVANLTTDRAFAATDGWTNAVIAFDTRTGVAAANKIKIYINGVLQTTTGTQLSTDDYDTHINANVEHQIGRQMSSGIGEADAYFAEMVMVEDQQLGPDSFGQVDTATNRWVPKDVSGLTFGDEGWYLEFDGTGFGSGGSGETPANGAGKDSSGNSNHWEEANDSGSDWATSDQFTDTPSKNFDNLGGRSNGSPTISQGNTLATIAAGGKQIRSTFNLNAGKWYVEVDIQATNNSASVGLVPSRSATFANGPGRDSNGGISYETDGDVFSDNVQNATAEASFAAGDVVQMAIDMDAKKVYFGKNNTFGGDPAAGTGGHFLPESIILDGAAVITLGGYSGSNAATMQINYGQFIVFDGGSTTNGFKFTPPTGFKAVNQDNLDDTASEITAFSWIKNRDAADAHILVDRLRGVGKTINSNDFSIETTEVNTVQRFLQRGVQVGNDVQVNTSSESYVMWQWLSGESAGTGSVTSPAGGISSNTIVSTPGNFSVGTYTGTGSANTVGHGLGGAPELIFIKNRSSGSTSTADWVAGTQYAIFEHDGSDPWTDYGHLDTTGNFVDNNTKWNDTAPNANTFTIGTNNRVNKASDNYVFYAFRSVPGVCKIGNYLGNHAGQPGPAAYINCGFTPRMVMVKNLSTSGDGWMVFDTARHPFNVTSALVWDNTTVESSLTSYGSIDILANGFKIQASTDTSSSAVRIHALNESDNVYLYLAMADIGGNGDLPPLYGR